MANKKRLIDADELAGIFAFLRKMWSGTEIMAVIDEAPTVDAVEVVHGRWEDEYGGKYANPRYRCSVCKKRALYKFKRDLLGSMKAVQALTPNCPYCMAELEGGTDNDI